MAILEKEVSVGSGGSNIKFYESIGYVFPRYKDKAGRYKVKNGTKIIVRVDDLSLSSGVKLTKICDECGTLVRNIPYHSILNGRNKQKDGLDRCHECSVRINGKGLSQASEDNCIANKDKEFAKILWDAEDANKYSCHSGKTADFKCLQCGARIKNKRIADVYSRGVRCPKCSDGVSYPEKFMFNVLTQLNIQFETQKIFNWSNNKRYDFYIPSLRCIIEVHGGQHYFDSKFKYSGRRTLQEEQENDRLKERLAIFNGTQHYIVIDARESSLSHIKDSISESELKKLFELEKVNWSECDKNATNSDLIIVCDLWNDGTTDPQKISQLTKLSLSSVYKYLNKGTDIGLCDYDGENTKEVVQLSIDMEFICEFKSISVAHKTTGIDGSAISKVCKRKLKKTGNHRWMYKHDYNNYMTNIEFKSKFDDMIHS